MNNRIKELRTSILKNAEGKKYTQQEFADRLGLSQNFIWQIEKGERTPSDRTVADICREFGVNRTWLETGIGDPLKPKGRDEYLQEVFADILSGRKSEKNAFIAAIAQLPEDVFSTLAKSWIEAAEAMKKSLE